MILDKTIVRVFDPGIYWFKFPNQYLMGSTFMRPQEFYESPFANIRGQYFTHEQFMDEYARTKNWRMSYYSDWAGFNIPGHILEDFYFKYQFHMSEKEKWLFKQLPLHGRKKFYVIGTGANGDGTALRHEIAHGLYYLDPEYKSAVDKRVKKIPKVIVEKIDTWLAATGYDSTVFTDELQAYLIESKSREEFEEYHEIEAPEDHTWFRDNFRSTLQKHGIDKYITLD